MKHKRSEVKKKLDIQVGVVYILATFNNTIVTITDSHGNTIVFSSAGSNGFSGPKKSTPYAAQAAAESAARRAKELGLTTVSIRLKGAGNGRDAAVRGISSLLNVTVICDDTRTPDNGCKPPKRRRV